MLTSRPFVPLLPGLLLALAAAACSSADDEPQGQESRSATSSNPALPTPAEGALPEFDRLTLAREKLGDAARATYSVTTTNGTGDVVAQEVGAYNLFPNGSFSKRFEPGQSPDQLTTVSVGTDVWFLAGQPTEGLGGCWAHRELDADLLTSELIGPAPRVLFTAGQLVGEAEEEIVAEVDPDVIAPVFPASVAAGIGEMTDVTGGAPVTFILDGEDLTGYRVSLDDVLAASEAADAGPVASLSDLDLQVEVILDKVGQPVSVEAPNPGQQVELRPSETVAHALERCGVV